MEIIEYNANYSALWDDFIENSKNGIFMFKRAFMGYHSDRFFDNSLMFFDKEKLIAILPANLDENVLYSHGGLTYGGFITDFNMKQEKMIECFDLLKNYMRKKSIKKLVYKKIPHIFQNLSSDEDLYALFQRGAKVIKVEPSSTIFLKNPVKMSKGRKAQISRAKREGVEIEQSLDFEKFIELENEVLQKYHNKKAVHTAEELKLLKSRFNEEIQLYVAKFKEEIISGALLFVYKNAVHTQYLASNEKGREIGALDLLIKTLIEKFATEKTYFDFGISSEEGGKILNGGLISQKEGFGARTLCYKTFELSAE